MISKRSVKGWLNLSDCRKKILVNLKLPMTVKQLSVITGIRREYCSEILRELYKSCLVYRLGGRFYFLTSKGKQYQKKILNCSGLDFDIKSISEVDWELYGKICYKNRSAVIQILSEPLQPVEIKWNIKKLYPDTKISANNVRDIVKLLLRNKIVKSVKRKKKSHPRV